MAMVIDINGTQHNLDVDDDMPLLWVLRDILELTGTKFGCGAGLCGACTVHIDGEAQFACQTPVSSVGTSKVTTIEVMKDDKVGSAIQAAWIDCDVVQCGYCQPGQIMRATALLARNPKVTDEEIREGMSSNICRCGCYSRIYAAIRQTRDARTV